MESLSKYNTYKQNKFFSLKQCWVLIYKNILQDHCTTFKDNENTTGNYK